jgi:hypothetical protein
MLQSPRQKPSDNKLFDFRDLMAVKSRTLRYGPASFAAHPAENACPGAGNGATGRQAQGAV